MSEQELMKWESKLKFFMVMNGFEDRELRIIAKTYCEKCIEGAFSRPCPSTTIQWDIREKKMKIKNSTFMTFVDAVDFICMEWIKHV
jgi:hypothetical protein